MANDPANPTSVGLLRALANQHSLKVLSALSAGELSGDLAHQIDLSQSALSQHLARQRREGLVTTRRKGHTMFYNVADHNASATAEALPAIMSRWRGGG